MSIDLFIQQIWNGLVLGSIYALVGSGVALIYGTMRVLNLAHGEFLMLAAFVLSTLVLVAGLPVYVGLPIACLAVALFAGGLEKYVIQPLMDKPNWEFSTIASTLGLSVVLQNGALKIWGDEHISLPYYLAGALEIGPLNIPAQRLLIFGACVGVIALLTLFFATTHIGKAIRATAQDREAAEAVGIPTRFIFALTFAISGGLAALAGILIAPITGVQAWMGLPFLMKAFVVVVLGGLGSFWGAILAAYLIGVVEAVGGSFVPTEWRDVLSLTLLIVILWVRPGGLLPVGGRQ